MDSWELLTNGSVLQASELLFQEKTFYFFYVMLIVFTAGLIYIATKNLSAVFMATTIGSVLLIYFDKVPVNLHFMIYAIMVLSLTFFLYSAFWGRK